MPPLPRNLHLVITSRSADNAIRKKTCNKTRLKCCACHAKKRYGRSSKCCARHEKWNVSSENVAKVLQGTPARTQNEERNGNGTGTERNAHTQNACATSAAFAASICISSCWQQALRTGDQAETRTKPCAAKRTCCTQKMHAKLWCHHSTCCKGPWGDLDLRPPWSSAAAKIWADVITTRPQLPVAQVQPQGSRIKTWAAGAEKVRSGHWCFGCCLAAAAVSAGCCCWVLLGASAGSCCWVLLLLGAAFAVGRTRQRTGEI